MYACVHSNYVHVRACSCMCIFEHSRAGVKKSTWSQNTCIYKYNSHRHARTLTHTDTCIHTQTHTHMHTCTVVKMCFSVASEESVMASTWK